MEELVNTKKHCLKKQTKDQIKAYNFILSLNEAIISALSSII